jgi:hypothetical protein
VYQASIIVSPEPVFQGNFQYSKGEKKSIKTVTMVAQSRPRENGSPTDSKQYSQSLEIPQPLIDPLI